MKIIKAKFNDLTEKAIFFDLTYKNFWGKIKTREVIVKRTSKESVSRFPYFVDNGDWIWHDAVFETLMREFEKHCNENDIHIILYNLYN